MEYHLITQNLIFSFILTHISIMGLPSDISQLVLTYASEPIYTLPRWIPKGKRIGVYLETLGNPRAYRWIKKNWAKIVNKVDAFDNSHPEIIKLVGNLHLTKSDIRQNIYHNTHQWINYSKYPLEPRCNLKNFFESCPNYEFTMKMISLCGKSVDISEITDFDYIFANINSDVIGKFLFSDLAGKLLKNKRVHGWSKLMTNTNPIAIGFIEKFLRIDSIKSKIPARALVQFCSNPSDLVLDLLNKYPDLIITEYLSLNKNPRALELIHKNTTPDYIRELLNTEPTYFAQPWALQLTKQELDNQISEGSEISQELLEKFIVNTSPELPKILDNYIDLIVSKGQLGLIDENQSKEIIEWVGKHLEYVVYDSQDDTHIDINSLACVNPYILIDNYGHRYPKKLAMFIEI